MAIPWKLPVSQFGMDGFFHHTKTKGDLGVLKAQLDLALQGYVVSIPLTEHAPFDLVISDETTSKTVQVKTRSLDKRGALEVRLASVWKDSRGVQRRPADLVAIDLYCIYCPDTDECYYIRPCPGSKSIKLRVRTPKNGQRKRIRMAKDHREVP